MPNLSTEYFKQALEKLSPEERDTIITDGQNLLQEFDFLSEELTNGIADQPKGINAVLQNYFYLYLWELRIIDERFIQTVSQVSTSDPSAYESVKTQFLNIIKEIPRSIIEPVLTIYNKKIKDTQSKFKQEINLDLVVSQRKSTSEIDLDKFLEGLSLLIANIQNMIKTDLNPKIEASFTSEKALFLKNMAHILDIEETSDELGMICEEITKIFRNWAENKEQLLDDEGRSRMRFLNPRPEAILEETQLDTDIALPMLRSFTPRYNQTKVSLLPLHIKASVEDFLRREQQDPEKSKKITESAWDKLKHSDEMLFTYLQGVIARLEHANRWVFAVQELSESDMKQAKLLSNNIQKA